KYSRATRRCWLITPRLPFVTKDRIIYVRTLGISGAYWPSALADAAPRALPDPARRAAVRGGRLPDPLRDPGRALDAGDGARRAVRGRHPPVGARLGVAVYGRAGHRHLPGTAARQAAPGPALHASPLPGRPG